jgi:FMN-dependent NADH-azoreductase
MKLLHVIASPNGDTSRSNELADAFITGWKTKNPEGVIDVLDLNATTLPEVTPASVSVKGALAMGKKVPAELQATWQAIEAQVERFLAADAVLISTPMWNFGVPYRLKHYVDVIFQPKYLFHYTADGPTGLIEGKPVTIVTSRGGDYSQNSPAAAMDQLEPYFRTAFGFIGITDLTIINAQGMDSGTPADREAKLAQALQAAANAA